MDNIECIKLKYIVVEKNALMITILMIIMISLLPVILASLIFEHAFNYVSV